MTTPLFNALTQHKERNLSSFHTPGHKGAADFLKHDLISFDYTELPDTDSLYEASGPILQAEKLAAELFGTARTLFSSGGCTLCIQAMLRLAAPNGGKIIAGRVLHRSAVNAMALLGLTPVWVYPKQDAGPSLAGRVQPEVVAAALIENPDAKAVYLTSPDYFGVISDISSISQICKAYHVPLLVDNAHGAHLWFTTKNLHPLSKGAAMTACSAHKTLPVLTGGAWLNLQDPAYAEDAKNAMALFGSTSPSYPIMASLDLARDWLQSHGKQAYAKLEEQIVQLKELAGSKGILLPEGETDPTRLSLNTASIGLLGTDAAEHFRNFGVEPEYADQAYLVLIATPWNKPEDFIRLAEGIRTMPISKPLALGTTLPAPTVQTVPLREAVLSPQEEILVENANGRIAAQAACPCPPGVPIVMPGEIICEDMVEFLKRYGFFTIKVLK